jgi:hypothetical protein
MSYRGLDCCHLRLGLTQLRDPLALGLLIVCVAAVLLSHGGIGAKRCCCIGALCRVAPMQPK